MASDAPLQAIGAYLLAIAKAHPQDRGVAPVEFQTDNTKALNSLTACLHEAAESGTPTNEEEYLRNSLLLFYNAANVFAGAISKRPEKRKKLCNQIEEVSLNKSHLYQPDILSFKILNSSKSTDVQPAALSEKHDVDQSSSSLAHHNSSPPQKPTASQLQEPLSPINSKVGEISSIKSRTDLKSWPDHGNVEELELMKCWSLIVRRENTSDYETLLSESNWNNFVNMCQYYNCNLDKCKKLHEELLELPSNVSDPFAKALAFWQSATELELRRESNPLRLYFYRWQLLGFRSSILEIARPPQGTKVIRKRSTSSPSRSHEIPRREIVAIIQKMLKLNSSHSRYPLVQKVRFEREGEDKIAEGIINKFDEAEHLRMMSKKFGLGVLALIPPSWQPFPVVWDHIAATVASHVADNCPGIFQVCSLIEDRCMNIMRSSNSGRIPERNLPWGNGQLQQGRRMLQSYVKSTSYSAHHASLLEQSATAKAQGLGIPKEYQMSIQAALDTQARLSRAPKGARTDAVFSFIHPANTSNPSSPQKRLGSRPVSISCEEVCRAASSKERSITLSPEKRKHSQVNR